AAAEKAAAEKAAAERVAAEAEASRLAAEQAAEEQAAAEQAAAEQAAIEAEATRQAVEQVIREHAANELVVQTDIPSSDAHPIIQPTATEQAATEQAAAEQVTAEQADALEITAEIARITDEQVKAATVIDKPVISLRPSLDAEITTEAPLLTETETASTNSLQAAEPSPAEKAKRAARYHPPARVAAEAEAQRITGALGAVETASVVKAEAERVVADLIDEAHDIDKTAQPVEALVAEQKETASAEVEEPSPSNQAVVDIVTETVSSEPRRRLKPRREKQTSNSEETDELVKRLQIKVNETDEENDISRPAFISVIMIIVILQAIFIYFLIQNGVINLSEWFGDQLFPWWDWILSVTLWR
ncbi:MAG: hypothetical protein LBG68_00755, partial [Coriobacteriales bacterium]|nr:hypothetical protein [Coriobacteriales bacterium]